MLKRVLVITTLLLLSACATQKLLELSSSETTTAAKQFSTSPDYGNLYIVWPDDYGIPHYSGLRISANNEEVGDILTGQFINIKAAPGKYSLQIDQFSDAYPEIEAYNTLLTEFDIDVGPNSLAIIRCDTYPQVIDDRVYLVPAARCDSGSPFLNKNANGVSYCGKINVIERGINFGGITYKHEDGLRCALLNDKSLVQLADMVAATPSISNDGDSEFSTAQTAGTATAYRNFIKDYPASKHTGMAKKEYERLAIAEANNAKEEKIKAKLARDAVLPLGIRKDKYMLTLTKYLKNQQYEESLLYFELLERLDVELSPSFDYFWGEALLRTSQPKEAIDQLYSYINKAGAAGTYYMQALELTNEAEAML